MKRTLVLIRHAKSSWTNPLDTDFERPLNDRGLQDAPKMGQRLRSLRLTPDLILSSSAKRARQTAELIAAELDYPVEEIRFEERLYHAQPAMLGDVLSSLPPEVTTVFLVGHNPGITDFANQLSSRFYIDHMPTCGVIAASFSDGTWEHFPDKKIEVHLFEYPKKL